jgi:hypothetical protein
VLRGDILKANVKSEPVEEPGEIEEEGTLDRFGRELRQELIKTMKIGSKHFDPAQDSRAWNAWRHLARPVSVTLLRQTHDNVSHRFRHGRHARESVEDLSRKLLVGDTLVENITPLVAVKFQNQLYVVFGNRRLKALKDYQRQLSDVVDMMCIVHDLDEASPVPHALVAKFLDAASSTNCGIHASFFPRRR